MRKVVAILVMIVCLAVPFAFVDILPTIGDPGSAPNAHVTDYYIEHAQSETNAPNMVTAVIVDYRAFDTMFETTVMFLAGLGVVIILQYRPRAGDRVIVPKTIKNGKDKSGTPVFKTINKEVMITLIEPLILVYAIYVLFHGEVSLGGGFQAGALMGMVYILDVMIVPKRRPLFRMSKQLSAAAGGVGTFIYVFAGILTLIGGGVFLEYAKLPISVHEAEKHSIGMLIVEIGVAICVMATIITILNAILERVRFDDDNN